MEQTPVNGPQIERFHARNMNHGDHSSLHAEDRSRVREQGASVPIEATPSTDISSRTLSVGGLRRKLTQRKLEKIDRRIAENEVNLSIRTDAPSAFIGREEVRNAHLPPYDQLRPGEQRHEKSMGNKVAEAKMTRSRDMWRIRNIYGDDIGTDEFDERVESMRTGILSGRVNKLRHKSAQKKYKTLELHAAKLERRVAKVAAGEDTKSLEIKRNTAALDRKRQKLAKKLEER